MYVLLRVVHNFLDENDPANDFIFVINGKEYPALVRKISPSILLML